MNHLAIPSGSTLLSGILHTPVAPAGNTLIISHGFRGSKDGGGRAVALAEAAAAVGCHVIRYDFTPLKNLSCQIAELNAVIAYARQTIGGRIFLLGRSMGGSASLAAAAADQKICGLILWATPWDLDETFRLALGNYYEILAAGKNLTIEDEYGHLLLTPDFIHDFNRHSLLACVKQLGTTPILVMHGTADVIVPVNQAHTLYQHASEPKQLILFPNGDHHLTTYSQEASFAVADWLSSFGR